MIRDVILCLALTGCVATGGGQAVVAPKQPAPLEIYNFSILVNDGRIVMSAEDGVKVQTNMSNMLSYIKQLQAITCFYNNTYTYCKEK